MQRYRVASDSGKNSIAYASRVNNLQTRHARALPRRAVLGAAAASPLLLVGACSSPDSGTVRDSDDQVRDSVAIAEATLIASYNQVIATFPELAEQLQPFLEQHIEHRSAMNVGEATPDNAAVIAAPASQAKALRQLRKAEREAAVARGVSAEAASSQDLVRTLTLVAASEAQHGAALASRP